MESLIKTVCAIGFIIGVFACFTIGVSLPFLAALLPFAVGSVLFMAGMAVACDG